MIKKKADETVPGVPVGPFVEEFCTKPQFDDDGVQVSSAIGQDGKEYPDPVPMSPPVGVKPPEDLMTTIRRMVHHEEFVRALDAEGFDTFEEAGDYDMEDDHEWVDDLTPYEAVFYPPEEKPVTPTSSPTPVASNAPATSPAPPSAPNPVPGANSSSTST